MIDGRYVLAAGNRVHFEIGAYDRSKPLIIDPVLSYATYLGGTGGDVGYGIAVDSSGNAYVTGVTNSANFPTLTPIASSSHGSGDAFVTKINPTGTALVYSTYLGGAGPDTGYAIAIDASGDAFVTGSTSSTDFPTTSTAFQLANGGNGDAFVAELDSAGSKLVYSSFLGGTGADLGLGIAVDTTGNAYVTGSTQSVDFPIVTPIQATNGGGTDVFVAKVNFSGTALTYSTYLGGAQADIGQAIKVDGSGNAFITGYTFSTNFPTVTPLQAANGGAPDAFVAEVNAAGAALTFSTYLGGSSDDRGFGIALDSSNNVYVTGESQSANFPTSSGAFQVATHGQSDAFVSKLNPTGSAFVYSTLLGGSGADQANGIAVDSSGDAFVTGFTQSSSDFPLLNAIQPKLGITNGGSCGTTVCSDAFVTELNPTGNGLVYSTFLGGSDADYGNGVALDSTGDPHVTGSTSSTNFPATAGAYQGTLSGQAGNVFIAKIDSGAGPAISIVPSKVAFGNQPLNVQSAAQTVLIVNESTSPLDITQIASSGTDFSVTGNCIGSIPGGGDCTLSITFTPTATTARTDTITITDNAAGSPHTFTATGTGVTAATAVTLSPTSLTFGNQTVGTVSSAQTVTITNTGTAVLNITSISTTGDYHQTNTCSAVLNSLNVGASCTVSVTFAPTATGGRNGTLSIADNAAGSPQTVALSGTGLAEFNLSSPTPKVTVQVGTTSTSFKISAASPSGFTGNITLTCSTGVACAFSPTTIFAGQSSTLTVSNLTATEANPLAFTVIGTSGSQVATFTLNIILADYALSATPSLNTIVSGAPANYTVLITPLNGFDQQVNLSCTGLPAGSTCKFDNGSVTPKGSPASVKLTLTTTKTASIPGRPWTRPLGLPPGLALWISGLALMACLVLRRVYFGTRPEFLPWARALRLAAISLTLATAALLAGCRNPSTGVTGGTPTGNYSITVTGTLNSNTTIVRSTTVNLAVT